MRDVGTTLLAIREAGAANLGVTLDFAHVLYAGEMPAHTVHLVNRHSRLLGVQLNDGYGKRDDGLMAGTVHPVQTVELLVALRRCGYDRALYFDTFPDTGGLDPVAECRANIETIEHLRAGRRGAFGGRTLGAGHRPARRDGEPADRRRGALRSAQLNGGVVVVGSLHLDVVVTAPRLPAPDETLMGETVTLVCGGKGGNQAVAASRHGAPTVMLGRRRRRHLRGRARRQSPRGRCRHLSHPAGRGGDVGPQRRRRRRGRGVRRGGGLGRQSDAQSGRVRVPGRRPRPRHAERGSRGGQSSGGSRGPQARRHRRAERGADAPDFAGDDAAGGPPHRQPHRGGGAAGECDPQRARRARSGERVLGRLRQGDDRYPGVRGPGPSRPPGAGAAPCSPPGASGVSAHGAGDVFVGALAARLAAPAALEDAIAHAQAAAARFVSTPLDERGISLTAAGWRT